MKTIYPFMGLALCDFVNREGAALCLPVSSDDALCQMVALDSQEIGLFLGLRCHAAQG